MFDKVMMLRLGEVTCRSLLVTTGKTNNSLLNMFFLDKKQLDPIKSTRHFNRLTFTKRFDLLINVMWLFGSEGFVAAGSLSPAETKQSLNVRLDEQAKNCPRD